MTSIGTLSSVGIFRDANQEIAEKGRSDHIPQPSGRRARPTQPSEFCHWHHPDPKELGHRPTFDRPHNSGLGQYLASRTMRRTCAITTLRHSINITTHAHSGAVSCNFITITHAYGAE